MKVRDVLTNAKQTLRKWQKYLPSSAWVEVELAMLNIDTALASTELNCEDMREALDYLCDRMAEMDATFDANEVPCLRAALAAPLRNCDVGTAVEQFERWETFCNKYDNNCTGCPLNGYTHPTAYCCAIWAQMPYKEGGAK